MKYWIGLALLLSPLAFADQNLSLPALTLTTDDQGNSEYSVTLQILAIMTSLTFIPAVLLMMTSFTRIIVVMAILRQAIGLQQTPSNQVLIGLSLFLTFFIMTPVFNEINAAAIQPYLKEEISFSQGLDLAQIPLKDFMLAQTRENDLDLFVRIAGGTGQYQSPMDLPITLIMPAFITSELKTAFQIGFLVFIPFLIIDLVVASVLMSMGMMMLSPIIVSLPFKVMLFVLVDGWAMIVGSLAASFGV